MKEYARFKHRAGTVLASAVLVCMTTAAGFAEDAKPLTVAMDVGYAPWAMQAADGSSEGFQVDVMHEVARQLGRPSVDIIDTNFSAIFAGLFAGRYELIGSPIAITAERAKEMAFTEPFIANGQAFITLTGEADFTDLEVLRGKEVATNSGSTADKYLTENADAQGWTVQRYDKDTDAIQAVVANRAYAALTDVYRGRYTVASIDAVKVNHVMPNQTQVGLALRKEDKELISQVEHAIECMKTTGTFAEIYRKWFGVDPDPTSVMVNVFPGTGPEGYEGYDATERPEAACI
jgi:polar amino acid transport system substrate-binding protein